MENIFLVKIQKNVKILIIKENIYTITFCQKFLTQLKSRILNFDHQNWSDFLVEEPTNIFLCQAEHVLIFFGI